MEPLSCLKDIGLVLLSSDFRVIGMNECAKQVLGPAMRELGKTVFHYHHRKSHPKIKGLLDESRAHPDVPVTMVIDVLNKALMINVSQVMLEEPLKPLYAITLLDVSAEIGAETNPHTGTVELKKFPVCSKGSLRFLDMRSIYFIRSDGNYCRLFTNAGSYYLHFTLKNILQRYAGLKFFRVHKSYIVNTDHIQKVEMSSRGHPTIMFDNETVPPVPVARRKLQELKNSLGVS